MLDENLTEKKGMKIMDLEQLILQYEKDFFCRDFCCKIQNLKKRLDDHFQEIGSSGKKIGRQEVIDSLSHKLSDRAIVIEEFQIEILSETAVLAKYIAVFTEQNQKSFRSSIWVKRGNDWRMLYHQGTYRSE